MATEADIPVPICETRGEQVGTFVDNILNISVSKLSLEKHTLRDDQFNEHPTVEGENFLRPPSTGEADHEVNNVTPDVSKVTEESEQAVKDGCKLEDQPVEAAAYEEIPAVEIQQNGAESNSTEKDGDNGTDSSFTKEEETTVENGDKISTDGNEDDATDHSIPSLAEKSEEASLAQVKDSQIECDEHLEEESERLPLTEDKDGDLIEAELSENEPSTRCPSVEEDGQIEVSDFSQKNSIQENTIEAEEATVDAVDRQKESLENLSDGEAHTEINNVAPDLSEVTEEQDQTVRDGTDTLLFSSKLDDQKVEFTANEEIQPKAEESNSSEKDGDGGVVPEQCSTDSSVVTSDDAKVVTQLSKDTSIDQHGANDSYTENISLNKEILEETNIQSEETESLTPCIKEGEELIVQAKTTDKQSEDGKTAEEDVSCDLTSEVSKEEESDQNKTSSEQEVLANETSVEDNSNTAAGEASQDDCASKETTTTLELQSKSESNSTLSKEEETTAEKPEERSLFQNEDSKIDCDEQLEEEGERPPLTEVSTGATNDNIPPVIDVVEVKDEDLEEVELSENEPGTCTSVKEDKQTETHAESLLISPEVIEEPNLSQEQSTDATLHGNINEVEEATTDAVDQQKECLESLPSIVSSSPDEGSTNAVLQEVTSDHTDEKTIDKVDKHAEVLENLTIDEAHSEINNFAPDISEVTEKPDQTVTDGADTLLLSPKLDDQPVESAADEIQQNAEEINSTKNITLAKEISDETDIPIEETASQAPCIAEGEEMNVQVKTTDNKFEDEKPTEDDKSCNVTSEVSKEGESDQNKTTSEHEVFESERSVEDDSNTAAGEASQDDSASKETTTTLELQSKSESNSSISKEEETAAEKPEESSLVQNEDSKIDCDEQLEEEGDRLPLTEVSTGATNDSVPPVTDIASNETTTKLKLQSKSESNSTLSKEEETTVEKGDRSLTVEKSEESPLAQIEDSKIECDEHLEEEGERLPSTEVSTGATNDNVPPVTDGVEDKDEDLKEVELSENEPGTCTSVKEDKQLETHSESLLVAPEVIEESNLSQENNINEVEEATIDAVDQQKECLESFPSIVPDEGSTYAVLQEVTSEYTDEKTIDKVDKHAEVLENLTIGEAHCEINNFAPDISEVTEKPDQTVTDSTDSFLLSPKLDDQPVESAADEIHQNAEELNNTEKDGDRGVVPEKCSMDSLVETSEVKVGETLDDLDVDEARVVTQLSKDTSTENITLAKEISEETVVSSSFENIPPVTDVVEGKDEDLKEVELSENEPGTCTSVKEDEQIETHAESLLVAPEVIEESKENSIKETLHGNINEADEATINDVVDHQKESLESLSTTVSTEDDIGKESEEVPLPLPLAREISEEPKLLHEAQIDDGESKKSEFCDTERSTESMLNTEDSFHVTSEDNKTPDLSQEIETRTAIEEQDLSTQPQEILEKRSDSQIADEAEIKEDPLENISNEVSDKDLLIEEDFNDDESTVLLEPIPANECLSTDELPSERSTDCTTPNKENLQDAHEDHKTPSSSEATETTLAENSQEIIRNTIIEAADKKELDLENVPTEIPYEHIEESRKIEEADVEKPEDIKQHDSNLEINNSIEEQIQDTDSREISSDNAEREPVDAVDTNEEILEEKGIAENNLDCDKDSARDEVSTKNTEGGLIKEQESIELEKSIEPPLSGQDRETSCLDEQSPTANTEGVMDDTKEDIADNATGSEEETPKDKENIANTTLHEDKEENTPFAEVPKVYTTESSPVEEEEEQVEKCVEEEITTANPQETCNKTQEKTVDAADEKEDVVVNVPNGDKEDNSPIEVDGSQKPSSEEAQAEKINDDEPTAVHGASSANEKTVKANLFEEEKNIENALAKEEAATSLVQDREASYLEDQAPTTNSQLADEKEEIVEDNNCATTPYEDTVEESLIQVDGSLLEQKEHSEMDNESRSSTDALKDTITESISVGEVAQVEDISSNKIAEKTIEETSKETQEAQDIVKSVSHEEVSPNVEDSSQNAYLVEGSVGVIDEHESTTSQDEQIQSADPRELIDVNKTIDPIDFQKETPAYEVPKEIESVDVKATSIELKEEEEGYLVAAHQEKSSDLTTAEKTPCAEDLYVNKDIIGHIPDVRDDKQQEPSITEVSEERVTTSLEEPEVSENNNDQVVGEANSCGDRTDIAVPTNETLAETDPRGSTEAEVQVPNGEKDSELYIQEAETDQKHIKETLLHDASEYVSESEEVNGEEKTDSNNCNEISGSNNSVASQEVSTSNVAIEADSTCNSSQEPGKETREETETEEPQKQDSEPQISKLIQDSTVENIERNAQLFLASANDSGITEEVQKLQEAVPLPAPEENITTECKESDVVEEKNDTKKSFSDDKKATEELLEETVANDTLPVPLGETSKVDNSTTETELTNRDDEKEACEEEISDISSAAPDLIQARDTDVIKSTDDSDNVIDTAEVPMINDNTSVECILVNESFVTDLETKHDDEAPEIKETTPSSAEGQDVEENSNTPGSLTEEKSDSDEVAPVQSCDIISKTEERKTEEDNLKAEAEIESVKAVADDTLEQEETTCEKEILKDNSPSEKEQLLRSKAEDEDIKDYNQVSSEEEVVRDSHQEDEISKETVELIKDGSHTEMVSKAFEEAHDQAPEELEEKILTNEANDKIFHQEEQEKSIEEPTTKIDTVKAHELAIASVNTDTGDSYKEGGEESEKQNNKNEICSSGEIQAKDEEYIMLSEGKSKEQAEETDTWAKTNEDDEKEAYAEDKKLDFASQTEGISECTVIDGAHIPEDNEISTISEDIALTEQASEATIATAEVQEAKTGIDLGVAAPKATGIESRVSEEVNDKCAAMEDTSTPVEPPVISTSKIIPEWAVGTPPEAEAQQTELHDSPDELNIKDPEVQMAEKDDVVELQSARELSKESFEVTNNETSEGQETKLDVAELKASPLPLKDKHVVLEADDAKSLNQVEHEIENPSKVEQEEAECGNDDIKPEPEDTGKPSLSELFQVSMRGTAATETEPTSHTKDLHGENSDEAEQENSKTDEEKDDEEESHEQQRSGSVSEAPVMVDMGDADVKVAHKKPHNILSGVGSKVKHSIAKVKKAITGKSSHPKPPSPKKVAN